MTKIAIIGMGAAGIAVLNAMAEFPEYYHSEITIFAGSQTIGTGLPYQADSTALLLNQTADTMSIKQKDPLDFVKWASEKKGFADATTVHLPRPWYGEYLVETMNEACERLSPVIIEEKVLDLAVEPDGSFVVMTQNRKQQFDVVHLCVGHLAYQDPYKLKGHPNFIYHPYPTNEQLNSIPNTSRVGIVGTGLTGIDMMRYLVRKRESIRLYFLSDTGSFTSVRGNKPDIDLRYLTLESLQKEKKRNKGYVRLSKMLEWFLLECEDKGLDIPQLLKRYPEGSPMELQLQMENSQEMGTLQAIIHAMDFYLPDYWVALTEGDKKKFLHDYQGDFERFRTPIPRKTICELLDLLESGQVSVHKEMRAVDVIENGFVVSFENGETIEVDYLINATGQNKKVEITPSHDDLISNLLDKRIVQPEEFGGVQVVWPSSAAVSQRYGVLDNLLIHGQLISGVHYGNNSAGMLRDHAYKVVKKMRERI